jgi:hypothetical protein
MLLTLSGSSEFDKRSILKFVPEERMDLEKYLESQGVKKLEKRVILINGLKISNVKDHSVEKDDEIIVLPLIKGG